MSIDNAELTLSDILHEEVHFSVCLAILSNNFLLKQNSE